jgi:hypothetical protein
MLTLLILLAATDATPRRQQAVAHAPSSSRPTTDATPDATTGGWHQVSRTDDLIVMARSRSGSDVNEMLAVGTLDAPVDVMASLISDIEGHKTLLPHTTVSKVMHDDGDTKIALQRSEIPFLQAREYVIQIREKRARTHDGRALFELAWTTAPTYARYVAADAVRIDVNEGTWTVEELANGKTRITFRLYVDPAGSVPAVLVNLAQGTSAQEVFAALRHHARRPNVATRLKNLNAARSAR